MNATRTHYREVLAQVAAKAKAKLPQAVNGRIDAAVKLVLEVSANLLYGFGQFNL
jgi:hypothetical protein